jgi:ABC-2 type transport system permease protein
MKTIMHIIRKEFLQVRRDKRMLPIIFVAPVFQLIILGYAANLDIEEIPTIICDRDRSEQSRELADKFTQSEYFRLVGWIDDIRDADGCIDKSEADLIIVFPRGFGSDLISGHSADLQVIADGSNAYAASIGLSYASGVVSDYSRKIALRRIEATPLRRLAEAGINPEIRLWYNPDLRSRDFMVPGILGLLLMLMTMLLTSLAIVKEKEVGTLEQLVVTPIKPYQLIIGKTTPFAIIGMIDVVLVILVATFWFNIPIHGSPLLLVFLCAVFLLTTLGLGLFISTVSQTQQQAMMTSMFFVMLPMIFLSGFVFPIENMPRIIQLYTYLLPLRYFFVVVRGIFLKGVGWAALWDEALVMLLFGIAILSLSAMRFRKRLK